MANRKTESKPEWPTGLRKRSDGEFFYVNPVTKKRAAIGYNEKRAIRMVRRANLLLGSLDIPRQVDHRLMTEDLIIGKAKPYRKVCGVYFLIFGGRVVYVGQSLDVATRLDNHWNDPLKIFDAYHVIECAPDELNETEKKYIQHLNPQFNIRIARPPIR